MKMEIDFNRKEVVQDLSELSAETKEELEITSDFALHRFKSVVELIAFILPDDFLDTENFKELEKEFLSLRLSDDAWLPIEVYAKRNGITRQGVYHRRSQGLVEIKKINGFSHARDVEWEKKQQ